MALFGWENAVDAAGVSLLASAAVLGFGPELLRVPIGAPSVAWQTPVGTLAASLTITSPAPIDWRAVCLSRTNLTMAATIRVRVGAYDSGVVAAGVAFGIGQALHVLPATVSAVTLQIDIADPTNPDGFLNVPLVFAGPAGFNALIAPATNDGLDIRTADTQTRGGTILTARLSSARGWQVTMSSVKDTDSPLLDALSASAAAGRNVLFVPRVGHARAAAESIFGLLAPGRRGFLGPVGDYRTWSATISERL
ncbi:MAG: hypothetical protein JWR10_3634 [Rubritepida sp.]|nr:hypothetical protein [Rubritepida sp.]